MEYFWIAAAVMGGFAIAWPIAYVWAVVMAIKLAGAIVERDFKRREDAYRALDEFRRQQADATARGRQGASEKNDKF